MKTKNKKLELLKSTVTNLDVLKLNKIIGGSYPFCHSYNCHITNMAHLKRNNIVL